MRIFMREFFYSIGDCDSNSTYLLLVITIITPAAVVWQQFFDMCYFGAFYHCIFEIRDLKFHFSTAYL